MKPWRDVGITAAKGRRAASNYVSREVAGAEVPGVVIDFFPSRQQPRDLSTAGAGGTDPRADPAKYRVADFVCRGNTFPVTVRGEAAFVPHLPHLRRRAPGRRGAVLSHLKLTTEACSPWEVSSVPPKVSRNT